MHTLNQKSTNTYSYYDPNDNNGHAIKKSKIGHLGLLAETCLKYSIEFNIIIESANSYSSAFSYKSKKYDTDSEKREDQLKKVRKIIISHF